MKSATLIRVAGALALLSCLLTWQAMAGIVALYDPSDSFSLSHSTVPQNAYTLFQALNDEHLVGLAVTYDPGPVTSNGPFWNIWESDSKGSFGKNIFQFQGNSLPGPDTGFGTYETPADLSVQAGQYYIVGFQANNDPNAIPYAIPKLPFTTSDNNFQVLGANDIVGIQTTYPNATIGQLSLDVAPVPEPSTLTLFGIGATGLIACGWRRLDLRSIRYRISNCRPNQITASSNNFCGSLT